MLFKKIKTIGLQKKKAANSDGAFLISGLRNPKSKVLLGVKSGKRRSKRSVEGIHIRIPWLPSKQQTV
jgi:hypothetical protein